MQFPDDWPETGCPPADAIPADGLYFRVAKSVPPTADDFRTQAELGQALGGDPCLRVGLSVFATRVDADHLRRKNKKLGAYIVAGHLSEAHGVTKKTPNKIHPAHVTWWAYKGVVRLALFKDTA